MVKWVSVGGVQENPHDSLVADKSWGFFLAVYVSAGYNRRSISSATFIHPMPKGMAVTVPMRI